MRRSDTPKRPFVWERVTGFSFYHAGMIAKARGDLGTARARLSEAFEVNPHFSPLYEPRAQAALDEVADGS